MTSTDQDMALEEAQKARDFTCVGHDTVFISKAKTYLQLQLFLNLGGLQVCSAPNTRRTCWFQKRAWAFRLQQGQSHAHPKQVRRRGLSPALHVQVWSSHYRR